MQHRPGLVLRAEEELGIMAGLPGQGRPGRTVAVHALPEVTPLRVLEALLGGLALLQDSTLICRA